MQGSFWVLQESNGSAPRVLYSDGYRLTRFMDRIYLPVGPYSLETSAVLELCRLRLELLDSISDETLRNLVANQVIEIARSVSIIRDMVLDFGAGSGKLTHMLSSYWSGSRICGADMCIKSLVAADGKNLVVIDSDGDLPFASRSFDVITALFVFHFRLPFGVRKDLSRILKDGGHLVGNVYGPDVATYERDMLLAGWELCTSEPIGRAPGHRVDAWHVVGRGHSAIRRSFSKIIDGAI